MTAPARGEMPCFWSFQKRANCSSPENADKERRLHALPPRVPTPFLPSASPFFSLAEAASPADLPTRPASASPCPWPPVALTSARARAGGGGVPAAHRAASRGRGAASWRPHVLGAVTEAEGGAPSAGGPRRARGARGHAGAAPSRRRWARARARRAEAGQGGNRRAPLAPTQLLDPAGAHPSPRQPRLRPIRSLLWAPRPSIGRR